MSDAIDTSYSRFDQLIGPLHWLTVLASRMLWQEVEAAISHAFTTKACAVKQIDGEGVFGAVVGLFRGGVLPLQRPEPFLSELILPEHLKYASQEHDAGLWALLS